MLLGSPLSMHKLKKDFGGMHGLRAYAIGRQLNGPPLGEERRAKRYELTTTLSFLMTYDQQPNLERKTDQGLYSVESTKPTQGNDTLLSEKNHTETSKSNYLSCR